MSRRSQMNIWRRCRPLLVALPLAGCLATCGTGKSAHDQVPTSVNLIGQWRWVGSEGGWLAKTVTPPLDGHGYSIRFFPDSTYIEYVDTMAVIRAKYTVDTGQTFIWGEQNQVPVVHLSDTRFFTMFNPFSKFGIKAAHDTITLATTGSETWLHHFVRSKQPAGDTVLAQGVPPRAHHEYVRIDVAAAKIRVDPNTSATVVGKAVKGDMFEYEGRQGDWLKINLFSGEYRWVRASVASLTRDVPAYLAPWNERKSIFEAMVRAEDRAERDARTRYPDPADFERKKDLERLLDDRYKLEVAHATGFPVLRWGYLMAEAVHGGWTPPRR